MGHPLRGTNASSGRPEVRRKTNTIARATYAILELAPQTQQTKEWMPMATQRTTSRVAGLDGLRTICALAVVGYHMRLRWLGGGLMGVTVLFVLSGYLITSNLMGEYSRRRGKIDIGGFYARRAWRLFPTCIVFIAVIGAVCALASPVLFTKMRPDIVPALLM
jgi:peptidoglycan/LPS O-acetylase OafA/YrhL